MELSDEELSGSRDHFRWSLQALAMTSEVQRGLFPDFVAKAEELAMDFEHWFEVARSTLREAFSDGQLAALRAIEARLAEMSLGGTIFDEDLWTEEALSERPEWADLRSLARAALNTLGLPIEPPPTGRSVYIPYRPADD